MLTPLLHPWFRLEKQSTAMYDLFGTVMVPSNSVEIIEMLFEAPAGVNLPDDYFPVLLELGPVEPGQGAVLPGLHMPLDFRATGTAGLPVGGDTGKTHVAVFAVSANMVLGSSYLAVPEPTRSVLPMTELPSPCADSGWVAWRNPADDVPERLNVRGFLQAESLSFAGKLAVAVPQGIDADELILNLSATATAVPEPFVPAKIPVVFTQNRPPLRYRSIQVHYPSGAACQFPVIDLEG
jgi:hypothetical protein